MRRAILTHLRRLARRVLPVRAERPVLHITRAHQEAWAYLNGGLVDYDEDDLLDEALAGVAECAAPPRVTVRDFIRYEIVYGEDLATRQ